MFNYFCSQSSETAATELINHGENFSGLNPSFSVDIEWEIPREHLKVEKVIGRGAFGVVSRGLALNLPERPGWSVVAVKSIQGQVIFVKYFKPFHDNATKWLC